jgi:endo-1,4-beta-xylanase
MLARRVFATYLLLRRRRTAQRRDRNGTKMLSRRQALAMAGSVAVGSAAGAFAPQSATAGLFSTPSRIPYGACVRNDPLQSESDYRTALKTYCQQLTSEGGLFWVLLRPARDRFTFEAADIALNFAEQNGMTLRGHTLIWYGAMPKWTSDIEGAADAEREMTTHIQRVMSHYRGKIKVWHVVNEAIDDPKTGIPGLRPNIWLQNLGETYIDKAFRIAHQVDPTAELILNEYDIECADGTSPNKREAFRGLIHALLDRGVPLHGVGLQGHIKGKYEIDRDGVFNFASEMNSLGLTVHITELDMIDNDLPGPIPVRDAVVATRAHDFIEPIFAAVRPSFIGTWGITDRYTWVPTWYKRKDGMPNRPLPLDENYQRKPLWDVIDYFCNR